jgi:hypothetical protein
MGLQVVKKLLSQPIFKKSENIFKNFSSAFTSSAEQLTMPRRLILCGRSVCRLLGTAAQSQ